jgi:hypothetical protein
MVLFDWHWSLMHGFLDVLDVIEVPLDLDVANLCCPIWFIHTRVKDLSKLLAGAPSRLFDTVARYFMGFLGLKRLEIKDLLVDSLLIIHHNLLSAIRVHIHLNQTLSRIPKINIIYWRIHWLLKCIWSKWLQEFILNFRLVENKSFLGAGVLFEVFWEVLVVELIDEVVLRG